MKRITMVLGFAGAMIPAVSAARATPNHMECLRTVPRHVAATRQATDHPNYLRVASLHSVLPRPVRMLGSDQIAGTQQRHRGTSLACVVWQPMAKPLHGPQNEQEDTESQRG